MLPVCALLVLLAGAVAGQPAPSAPEASAPLGCAALVDTGTPEGQPAYTCAAQISTIHV